VIFFDIETYGPGPKGAINPVEGKIITAQIRRNGRNVMWKEWARGGSELHVIDGFLDYVKEHAKEPLIGDNLLRFDIPFILTRWVVLKRKHPSPSLYLLLYQRRMLDLYQILLDSYVGVKDWAAMKLGLRSAISGKDIPKLYEKKQYRKIESYANDELRKIELVYNWMLLQPWYKNLERTRRSIVPEGRSLFVLPPTIPNTALRRLERSGPRWL